MSLPGGWEWLVILIIGLLLFGRRLPEVGRAFGKTIVEFKKGMAGVDEEVDAAVNRQAAARSAAAGALPASPTPVSAPERRVGTHDSVEQ